MKKIGLKLLALILVAAMVCGMIPAFAFAAESETVSQEISKKAEAIIEADIWDKIDSFEKDNIIATRDDPVSVQDYADLSDEIEALVKQSETYVEGSVVRNGDFFTWETTEGIVCGYSPELRFKIRDNSETGYDSTEVKSYATKAAPSDKDVYLIAPYYGYDSSFTNQYKNEASSIASATGGEYTLYQGTNATITNIATAMQNGGVVIFDSHGITDYSSGDDYVSRANSSYLCLKTSTGITSSDMSAVSGTYGTYYHAFNGGSSTYCVDGTAIKNHMSKAAPGTILWMAICLGMATNGLCTPMRNAGVEVVYGYSQSVSFTGDYKYETYFWNKMKAGSDVATAISYMKSASGSNWDPAYSSYSLSQAKSNYVAFPIVVSDQDSYPGQGKVDAVQTVKSTYKLLDSSSSGGSSGGDSTGDNNTAETYTYNLVTSASALTAGEYIIIATASGSYAGDYSYYALTTSKDGSYGAMQSSGLSFTSVPSAVTCDSGSAASFVFTLTGNANGFTLKNSNGSLYGGGDSTNGVFLYYGTASTWTGSYVSASQGFRLKTGSTYMALCDNISTTGTNGAPMFATSTSTSGSTIMHMYKKESAGTCSHSSTSTTTTPATCTTPGATVVTCNACSAVVSNTEIPATGHNITYTSNNDGTHKLYCSNCNGTGTADCTYTNNVCKYCGYVNSTTEESTSDRYVLVTSASDLTGGEYLIMATATGSYAGDYGYYIMLTTADTDYTAIQSAGLNFDSLPNALLLDSSATAKYVWTVTGSANSFTLKNSNGSLEGGLSDSSVYLKYGTASKWKATYSSTNKGFILNNGTVNLVLRDDISTTGANGSPLFVVDPSTGVTVYMHLYKKEGSTTVCSHSNTSTTVVSASCTAAGETVVTCDDCGEVVSTTAIPATGHNTTTTTTPATCTTAGKTVEVCITCGTTVKTTTIPATGHTSKTTTTPATCTTEGKTVESCTTCGATIKTTTIPATGHTSKTTTTAATCTTDGKTVETCTTCGATIKTTTIPATGHTSKTTTTAATCTTDGKTVESCTTCGATIKTTTIPATGHTVKTTTTAATCTVSGKTVETCTTCGVTIKTTVIPATGHTMAVTTTEPTCTAPGKTVETCTVCGATKQTATAEALDHDFTYTSNGDGTHNIGCSRCDYAAAEECALEDNTCPLCGYTAEIETPETPETELVSGAYVIAALVNGEYYAMSNTFAGKIAGTPMTVVDGKVSATDAEGYVIILDALEEGWTIQNPDGDYLKYNSSTNLAKTDTAYGWTIIPGINGTWRVAAQTEGRGLVFRAKTYNQFGGYATSNCTAGSAEYFDIELLPVEGDAPAEPFEIRFNHSLNIASDISINYAVTTAQLEGYENFYLECVIPTYENGVRVGGRTVTVEPVLNGSYYYFTMDGVTAVQMNDVIEATLYAYKGTTLYVSEADLYSVATYAYNQLDKGGITVGLKTLCAELLRYGAKAQIFKNYRTDSLADNAMTDTHKALLGDLEAVVFNQNNKVLEDIADPIVTWAGKGLVLDSKVTLRMVVDLSKYDGDLSELTVRVTYTNLEGEEITEILDNIASYSPEKNYYAFSFSGLRAAELRTVVSAAVYAGETQVSPTLQYSMDTYGNGRTGDLLTLCRALMSYSDSALRYFKN